MRKVTLGFLVCLALPCAAQASAYSDFNAGLAARNEHDADGAIRFLSQALAAPDLPAHLRSTAYFSRAQAYGTNKQIDLAIADLTSSLALAPDDFDVLTARASLYQEKKLFDLARADFTAAIAVRPELIDGYYGHAGVNMAERKYDDAIKDYDAALAALPGDIDLLLLRGDAAREAGRYDAAVKDFSDAISANSRYGEAYLLRGRAYLESGDPKSAVSDYEDAIDLNPDDAGLREIAGIAQWEYGNYRDAARNFSKAAADSGRAAFSYLWLYLADAKRDAIDAELAQDAAKADLRKWPGPLLGLFIGTGSVADVEAAAKQGDAGEQSDHACTVAFFVGEWHLMRKEQAEARTLLVKAAACRPGLPESHAARAEIARLGP
ncbi:MAG TPA: tetratricopeptide repeat protein [Rhizomicrobium sp.]|nr:tetratricopeptide repeat protein [Rhizomicrobium sp.]